MIDSVVNIQYAKTQLSKLVLRVERGENIVITRAGKPVARLSPMPRRCRRRRRLQPDDPLLDIATFAVDGSGESLNNAQIDRLLYGRR
jgi:prevent-host-death family protein